MVFKFKTLIFFTSLCLENDKENHQKHKDFLSFRTPRILWWKHLHVRIACKGVCFEGYLDDEQNLGRERAPTKQCKHTLVRLSQDWVGSASCLCVFLSLFLVDKRRKTRNTQTQSPGNPETFPGKFHLCVFVVQCFSVHKNDLNSPLCLTVRKLDVLQKIGALFISCTQGRAKSHPIRGQKWGLFIRFRGLLCGNPTERGEI